MNYRGLRFGISSFLTACFFFIMFLILEREEGRAKHWLVDSNQKPSGAQDDALTAEPHRPGQLVCFSCCCFLLMFSENGRESMWRLEIRLAVRAEMATMTPSSLSQAWRLWDENITSNETPETWQLLQRVCVRLNKENFTWEVIYHSDADYQARRTETQGTPVPASEGEWVKGMCCMVMEDN